MFLGLISQRLTLFSKNWLMRGGLSPSPQPCPWPTSLFLRLRKPCLLCSRSGAWRPHGRAVATLMLASGRRSTSLVITLCPHGGSQTFQLYFPLVLL